MWRGNGSNTVDGIPCTFCSLLGCLDHCIFMLRSDGNDIELMKKNPGAKVIVFYVEK